MVNLLENGCRYSPPGASIRISAEQTGRSIVVMVEDQGVGIPSGDLESIFEKFYRGRQAAEGRGNTGLGLAMVKKAVERMRGRIWAESTPQQGSMFFVELPLIKEL